MGARATQTWDESRPSPLVPFGARDASKNFSVCQQERQRLLQMAMGQVPQREGLTRSWRSTDAGSLGSLQMDLARNRHTLDWVPPAQLIPAMLKILGND